MDLSFFYSGTLVIIGIGVMLTIVAVLIMSIPIDRD
jgi:hypothetical protein